MAKHASGKNNYRLSGELIALLVVLALIGAVICGIVALVAVRDERNKRRELATDQTETQDRLAEAAERAKELEGVRLDTAAEARRLVTGLQGRLTADPA